MLCEVDVSLEHDHFQYQWIRSRATYAAAREAINDSLRQLSNITDTAPLPVTEEEDCWPLTIGPTTKILNFSLPTCISSQQDITDNAAKLTKFNTELEVYHSSIKTIFSKIQATPDISVTLFFHGRGIQGIKAYFGQLKPNFLSYLIISNLVASLYTAVVSIYWMRNRACCKPSSRQMCGKCVQPMMAWCCVEELPDSPETSPVLPPRRRAMPVQYQAPLAPLALTYQSYPAVISD